MRLYLVQHGEAVSKEVNPQRPLSNKGRLDVKKMGNFLKRAGLKIDLIWHSGKTRAQETAEILAEALSSSLKMKEGIAPLDPVVKIERELRKKEEDLMIVGHLPFLERLASVLLIGSDSPNLISFQKGGTVCLEREEKKNWSLKWMVVPQLLSE